MDLNSLIPADTIEVVVLSPRDGTATDITITLAGPAHPSKQAYERRALDARFKRKAASMDVDALLDESQGELVARTLAWTNMVLDGVDLPCTPENVEKVYDDPRFFWLRNQVANAAGDTQRFFPN